jgi:protein-tyrosine phosphatase
MDRTELHFHLLPGVDDGPADLATALHLAREAVQDGTRLVICTPHAKCVEIAEVPGRVAELQSALESDGIELTLRPGAELSWDDVPGLDGDALDRVAHGPRESRWLLLEAPLRGMGELDDLLDAAHELHGRGYNLLIGHPERSPALRDAPQAIGLLLGAGHRLQVNGSSLTGAHGEGAHAAALRIVRSGLASVIASDAHRPVTRGPVLGAAVDALAEQGMTRATAERLVGQTPRELLAHGLAPAQRLAA